MRLAELVAVLSDPALYPGPPPAVELRQTHASAVFLTPTDVYKLKKPVALGFLDYSTLPKRGYMSRREVALNRRLAPGVYLGVERLVRRPNGSLHLGGRGLVVDYLVHMRRLPDGQMLSSLLAAGEAGEEEVARVARRIAHFHAETPAVDARFGSPRILWRNAADNFRGLEAVPGDTGVIASMRAELEAYTRLALHAQGRLLRDRAANGRVRDGHGDLRCEHIYFHDGEVLAIDCIEFDRRYRYADVALDLAFLAMDLAALGYPDFGRLLADEYVAASGDDIRSLMPLFCSYRATVRAKVAVLRALEGEFTPAEREQALIEALRYLVLALRFARHDSRPALVLVSGLSGTGKSTVARLVQQVLPGRIISSDRERKRLAGVDRGEHGGFSYGEGLYAPEMNERVYERLLDEAAQELCRGRSVTLDATYRRRDDRLQVLDLARRFGAQSLSIECTASEAALHDRFAAREAQPDPWSDANWETYVRQRGTFEPFASEELRTHLALDTEPPAFELALTLAEALAYPRSLEPASPQ